MRYIMFYGVRYFLSLLVGSLLVILPEAALASSVSPGEERSVLTPDQRAVQVISRLTFGARPGDLDRVKKMGVDAFIAEQLNPDNIDDSALQKRLDKLPTPSPTPAAASKTVVMDGKMEAAAEMSKTAVMTKAAPAMDAKPSPSPTPAAKPTPTPKNPQMVITELQRAKLLRVYTARGS